MTVDVNSTTQPENLPRNVEEQKCFQISKKGDRLSALSIFMWFGSSMSAYLLETETKCRRKGKQKKQWLDTYVLLVERASTIYFGFVHKVAANK